MASGRMSSGSRGGSNWMCGMNSPVRAAPGPLFVSGCGGVDLEPTGEHCGQLGQNAAWTPQCGWLLSSGVGRGRFPRETVARNTICQEYFFPEEAGEVQDGPSGLRFLWVLFTQAQKPFPSEGEVKANSGLGRSKVPCKSGAEGLSQFLDSMPASCPCAGPGRPYSTLTTETRKACARQDRRVAGM